VKVALALALAAQFPGTGITQLSDAPASHPVISQDKRFGRLVAFEQQGDIYATHRANDYGENGSPWHVGSRELVSAGLGGAPSNGPSFAPAVDGTSRVAPHCVAFVSAASNLVPGDTNGKPDAFVRDLRTGKTKRVSVNSRGKQSNGTVTEVAIDGLCRRVAFVSDATDLALRKTKNRNWKTAVTKKANPPGVRQVYVRGIGGSTGIDRALKGLTFLASATDSRRPGNGDSFGLAYATNADRLTFASDASNLTARDGNGATDVFQRVMSRRYGKAIHGRKSQYLRMDTRLVSMASGGSTGTGPSSQPATNVDGRIVAFTTSAPDLVPTGGVAQIARADTSGERPKLSLASSTAGGAPGNGASADPSLSAAGTWVAFDSEATNLGVTSARQPDTNGVRDAMLATEPSHDRWLLGEEGATVPTTDPVMSPHGNYIVFVRGGVVDLLYVGAK
jgi:hypothetical protein